MAINSTEWAWSDMTISLNGVRVGKVTKLTVKTARETEHLYGEGDEPFDVNPGNKAYTGELEVFATVVRSMNVAALAQGYDDLTDVPWLITAHFKPTATEPMKMLTIPGVRFDEFEEGGTQNDKSFKKNMPFKCLKPTRI